MCDSGTGHHSVSRRSLLGAAMAGTGGMVAASLGATPAGAAAARASAAAPGAHRRPLLPVFPDQPQGTVLSLLGTAGGPQADYVRTGTSSVLTVDGYNYVIDAGRSSVTQYLNAGLRFSRLAGMFITHLHADHLADYYNYFLLEGGEPNAEQDYLPDGALPVYGPGPAGALPPSDPDTPVIAPQNPTPGLKDLTERLNEGYAYSYNLFLRDTDARNPLTLQQDINEIAVPDVGAGPDDTAPPMDPFTIFEDDRVCVSAILVPHGPVYPSFAFRFDTDTVSVVFSGDTRQSDNVVRIADGADVLVHEVINLDFISQSPTVTPELLDHLKKSHTTTSQVAEVAEAAGVPKLVLTHLIPSNPALVSDWMWQTKCSSGYRGRVHVGNDLDQVRIPTRRRTTRVASR